ncbi:actin depolymerizing protein [Basidiobolus meristosporus CBS 931.73]|uniref:Actin depolymerizing protein n=1 Tax=Basidiobolus meristosporus CBS 931.73 TaxID=1314790 RepID=A0A1Y1Y8L4_9FUNG|nr:actin depolymerizing protein [Basidiobolus meristosporus CBS 931.73]|eukprot:ORX94318.1 actin depolymerizing protein [Basidiobolus meristosporus CBS 931.73]
MSCDLSDPAIAPAYEEVATGQGANWLILGYHDSRDTISLYTKGAGGLEEFKAHLTDEVLYGYLNFENNLIFVTYISENVSGIRRARAFVHGKHVATMLSKHDVYFTASSLADLTESNILARIRPKSAELAPDNSESQPPVEVASNTVEEPPVAPQVEAPPEIEKASAAAPTTELPPIPAPRPGDDVEAEDAEEEFVSPVEALTPDNQSEHFIEQEVSQESRSLDDTPNSSQQAIPNGAGIPEEPTKDPKSLETDRILEENLKKREDLMNQVLESENLGNGTSLTGYITVQGGGVYFWKRRWFALRGNTLYLYRDAKDKYPLSSIDLGVGINRIEDARSEVLIPNSFRVEFSPNEVYHFFADTSEEKAQIMSRFLSCVATQ